MATVKMRAKKGEDLRDVMKKLAKAEKRTEASVAKRQEMSSPALGLLSASKKRRQPLESLAKKCPWKVSTDPHEIPNGYCEEKHVKLAETIARPGELSFGDRTIRMMACHETPAGKELPCVGWLVHQLGEGNNLQLRMAVITGQVNADVVTVGEQHTCLEDTLP